jgi:hypothetical protein
MKIRIKTRQDFFPSNLAMTRMDTTLSGLMVTSVKAGHRNCPKNLRLSEPTAMTIHWNVLEERFLIVPLMF